MFQPSIRVHSLFDRKIIRSNWKAINETPLKRAGLFVRRVAINSLKRVKHGRPSPPGTPPFSHAWRYVPGKNGKMQKNKAPLQLIYSVPELLGTRVIVGPVGFGNPEPVPAVHEFGMTVMRSVIPGMVKQGSDPGRDKRTGRFTRGVRVKAGSKRVRAAVTYPKRATMGPALVKSTPKLPPMWRGSLSS